MWGNKNSHTPHAADPEPKNGKGISRQGPLRRLGREQPFTLPYQ